MHICAKNDWLNDSLLIELLASMGDHISLIAQLAQDEPRSTPKIGSGTLLEKNASVQQGGHGSV